MHSIGGTVKPVPDLQSFSYVAHIEHSQLLSSLGPNPGYCVEAPAGCDVHITGPSSLEDCGCLIYFVSNHEYQRTSKEECDAAGKAHYELYTGEAGVGVGQGGGREMGGLWCQECVKGSVKVEVDAGPGHGKEAGGRAGGSLV
jgi:hypothetical protein